MRLGKRTDATPDESPPPELIASLVRCREAAGLTVADVSWLADMSPEAVAAFEQGTGDPALSTVLRYADAVRTRIEVTTEPDGGGRA